MTTPELRSAGAGGEAPISPAELSRLASQIYAELAPLQVASPAPPTAPPAPRGSASDTTSAASGLPQTADAAGVASPVGQVAPDGIEPATFALALPGPDTPPYTVPVAPRGSAPGSSAATEPLTGHRVPVVSPSALPSGPAGPAAGPVLRPSGFAAGGLPSLPLAPGVGGVAIPQLPDLGRLLAPWGAAEPTPVRPDRFSLADQQRSGGLPPNALKAHPDGFDVETVRKDFPILTEQVNGHPLIWFDNAATTQKPQAVIDRLAHFYAHENSNIHRAAHELAARATDAYEDARDTVRDFLGAGRSEEIIFVRGATEGINLVAHSWGSKNLGPGDEILITHLEHHANIVPWQIVAQRTGAVLKVAPVDDSGNLLLEEFTRLLGPRTRLVAATQVANAVGTVNNVEAIVALAHRAGARVLIDGAQSVPHLAVNLQRLDPDFFVFSGHKVFGPTGIGAVYLSERIWDETPAWQGGGNMIADVTIERSIYQGPPNKYEAGTGNIADAVGLAAALRYVNGVGIERIAGYEHSLLDYATPRLAAIPGVTLVGTADAKASVLSFVLAGHEPEDVGKALNERGIAVRAGHHCAQPILRRLGVEKTVRPSFAFYNTVGEIDRFLEAVRDLSERGTAV
ncbi:Cysteine desulfurase [Propionicimonas sp. T2.31MG-18]|uniref:family 2A encapsulin nanocompartment cargo protein cysteine desulfurase n=1 Tax=Propionicimonas sp. T2.31MG-18 TaxID=3157620 RepID=UPI0035ED515B